MPTLTDTDRARELAEAIKTAALELGFTDCGITPAVEPAGLSKLHAWLEAGYAGQMNYLSERTEAYTHPRHVLDGAKSIVVLAMNYRTEAPAPITPGYGRVSRYAWGTTDYHDLIHERLKQLAKFVHARQPQAKVRGVVDTAPLLERELAQVAGLGWIGKHTLLLNRRAGSWFFLAALLTDLELPSDDPHASDHCGTCTACLDACPTQAFPQPHVLDATRCISYLTIELRDAIPSQLRAGIGDWLFGCDVCQEVCPWNRRAPQSQQAEFAPAEGMNLVELTALFDLDDEGFRQRFRRTPLWRTKRRGLLRNAAIVLGNQRPLEALPALARGLNDPEPLIRGACAWALGEYVKHGSAAARQMLSAREAIELDDAVKMEISRIDNP